MSDAWAFCADCMRWGAHPEPRCGHDNTAQCERCNLMVGYPARGQLDTTICHVCYEAERGPIP